MESTPPAPSPAPAPTAALPTFLACCVGAAGVVFGDIGTSPLYAFSQLRTHGVLDGPEAVLGAASLVFWTLTIAVFGKYLALVLAADNHGEGGAFALLAQVQHAGRGTALVVGLLTFSACLLYGEGLITPALSILSATEGLRVVRPGLAPLVVPLTLVVLTLLFLLQRRRSDVVDRWLGGVMITWFLAIGTLGALQVGAHPEVLGALLPHHAASFLWTHGLRGAFGALGAVVLCITGSEALYAGMGPFGARAIRTAWAVLVYPALVLQYLGQAAFLVSGAPVVDDNVFFSVVPEAGRPVMVGFAILAAAIAGQALVTSAFGLTRSAINLGLLPRVQVVHTSAGDQGRIYVPPVNWLLWAGSGLLVLQFGSVRGLAAAYGLSVVITMGITTVAVATIAVQTWGWPRRRVGLVFGTFALLEAGLFVGNATKLPDGAWIPLLVAGVVYAISRIWQRGRSQMAAAIGAVKRWTVAELLDIKSRLPELPRAMVFLTPERVLKEDDPIPLVLLKFVDRYGSLPRHVTLFSVATEAAHPYWRGSRFDVRQFGDNVTAVCLHLGYMETPNTRAALAHLREMREVRVQATKWTIVMGREEVIVPDRGFASVADQLFSLLAASAVQADHWFGVGSDTGISKEVIPLVFDRRGRMVASIHKPDLADLPPPKPPDPEPTPTEGEPVVEDTSLSDIPRVLGTEEVSKGST